MHPKTENLTSGTAAEMEFNRMYQEMVRAHIKPLWTDEARILPRSPAPLAVPWLWKWSQRNVLLWQRNKARNMPLPMIAAQHKDAASCLRRLITYLE